jgi:hypothetical protein
MNPSFNYYDANIKNPFPLGSVSLEYLLNAIRKPKQKIQHIFDQIRQAEEDGDMTRKAELKSKLYYFTPCVTVKGSRRYENIQSFTGLMVLDFDHLQLDMAAEFKKYLFNKYKFIIAAWLSASRHGVRAVVKIPIVKSIVEFKHHFAAIEKEMNKYYGFDKAPKNCILPMFMSYDPELLYRDNPTTWDRKHIEIKALPVQQYIVDDKTFVIEKIIAKKIIPITGNGHPQLRAAAYLMGGYVGAGYIHESYAVQILERLIDSNAYLVQKSSVYKMTAKHMIEKGQSEPVFLSNYNTHAY